MTLLLNPIFSLNDGGIYWIFASVIEVYPNDGHYFAKYPGDFRRINCFEISENLGEEKSFRINILEQEE